MHSSLLRPVAVLAVASGFGCVPVQSSPSSVTPNLPPAGFGTLRQDDITVTLERGSVALRLTPLAEIVLLSLAPDSYAALSQLRESHSDSIDAAGRARVLGTPVPFLVTFFSRNQRAEFTPGELNISASGGFYRPEAIIPLTPGWAQHILRPRQAVRAIYVYRAGIDVMQPFEVSYGAVASGDWRLRLATIEQELARIRTRAGIRRPDN